MILVDTSVWVDYFRHGNGTLADALRRNTIRAHPWIVGELAMGNLADRTGTLEYLRGLPPVTVASDPELDGFIEQRCLYGRGIGYVDAALLAATALTPNTRLWTTDRRLRAAAQELGISAD